MVLIHPGEFGRYRENICKEFFKNIVPSKYHFADGFIINAHGDISTQCDIILFDPQNTPLIMNDENQRFFSVETVVMVSEVKSIMTNQQFADSLIKFITQMNIRTINYLLFWYVKIRF